VLEVQCSAWYSGIMNRRGFLSALLGAVAAPMVLDPERLLWVPGAKTISIPSQAVMDGWEYLVQEDVFLDLRQKEMLHAGDKIWILADPPMPPDARLLRPKLDTRSRRLRV